MPKRNQQAQTKVVINTAEVLGFTVVRTPKGHRCAVHPSGAKVFFATTSTSARSAKNAIAMLRRTARQLSAAAD